MALLIGNMTLKLSTDCRVSEMFWQREIRVVNIALLMDEKGNWNYFSRVQMFMTRMVSLKQMTTDPFVFLYASFFPNEVPN